MTHTPTSRVPRGVPTGGQFAPSTHDESQVTLGLGDPWGALTESVEKIRAEALAEGRRQGLAEAAAALHEWRTDLADEISGHTLGTGYYSFRVGPDDAREMTDSLLAEAQVRLQALGDSRDAEPTAEAVRCTRCLGRGQTTDWGAAGPNRDDCPVCTGTGTVPPTPLGEDTVEVPGWGTFHRRRDGVYPGTPYTMRFEANRPLTDDEMTRVAQLVGYRYAATVRGENLGWPARDSSHSFVVPADTTKSRSDDLGMALEDFEDDLDGLLLEGSPVRSTNRAGAGTKGTRLVDGLGDPDLHIEIYYDDVVN